MKGKQPTIKTPNRPSIGMTKLSGKGNSSAKGKAASRHATMAGYPIRRNSQA